MTTEAPGLLAEVRAGFVARGWAPSGLDAFRMEDDGGDDLDEPLDEDEGGDAPAGDAPDEDDPSKWTPEYVKGLRAEAAKHRTANERFASAFDGIDDGDQDVLLELARQWKDDPEVFAQSLRQIATALGDDAPPAPAKDEDDPTRALTVAEFDAWQKAQQSEAQAKIVADNVAGLQKQAEELGYDATSRRYFELLWEARANHGGDLAKAHEVLEADRQKVIDDYVAGKKGQAAGSPKVPANKGGAATEPKALPSMYLPGTMNINPEWRKAARGE